MHSCLGEGPGILELEGPGRHRQCHDTHATKHAFLSGWKEGVGVDPESTAPAREAGGAAQGLLWHVNYISKCRTRACLRAGAAATPDGGGAA